MKRRLLGLVMVICIISGMLVPVHADAATFYTTPMVSAGGYYTVLLKETRDVLAWGRNEDGQLGDGTTTNRATQGEANLSWIKEISAGQNHTVALSETGEVWTWGDNYYGQLGDGSKTDRKTPFSVGMGGVKQISAGGCHTVVLKENGEVWAWGNNYYGQLGDGTTTNSKTPVKVDISGVKQISAGYYHTVALKENGEVWTWGYNHYGQLGDRSTTGSCSPVKVNISAVNQISAGNYHTVALKLNGDVWAWGRNCDGQLGCGTIVDNCVPVKVPISGIKQISAGGYHTAALKENGEVWAWGSNGSGELGDGTRNDRLHPVRTDIDGVNQVSAGYYHTVALKENGTIWAWGYNYYGELGDGTRTTRITPVDINASSVDETVVIQNDGIEINHRGNAYGRFLLRDKDGNTLKDKNVKYTIDGYQGEYCGKTNKRGVIIIETPELCGESETKTITVRFPYENLEKEEYSFDVYIKKPTYYQIWEGQTYKGTEVNFKLGAGGEIPFAEAEASLGNVGANDKLSKNISVRNIYDDGVRTLRIASKMDSNLAAKAKVGLFANAKTDIVGAEISVGDIRGEGGLGVHNEIALKLEGYNPNDMEQLKKIAYFLLDFATDTNDSNAMARRILEAFNSHSYNENAWGSTAFLKRGATIGGVEVGSLEGNIVGFGDSATWSYNALKDKNGKNVYTTGIVTDSTGSIGNMSVKKGTVGISTSLATGSFLNNKAQFWATNGSNDVEEFKIRAAEKSNNNSFFWRKSTTDYYNTIKYSGENAKAVAGLSKDLADFANGKKLWFSGPEMTDATELMLNSDIGYDYVREKQESEGLFADFTFGVSAGWGLGIGFGASLIETLNYETENGKRIGDEVVVLSKSSPEIAIEAEKETIFDILYEPIEVIKNHIASMLDTVTGWIKDGVTAGTACVKSTSDKAKQWIVSIVSCKDVSTQSYNILCVDDEISLFSTSSVASTIGEPYIVSVHDENGTEITDFGDGNVEITLSYDEEMLAAAGVNTTDEELEKIDIYFWDDEKGVYICNGGKTDIENSCVTANIVQPGQYILAIDNCAPAVTEFSASNSSSTPQITAVVADMSGISEFEFAVDGEVLVTAENMADYYNPSTALFSYIPAKELEDGTHTATIYAKDSSGNELAEPAELIFTVNTVPPVMGEINIPEYTVSDKVLITAQAEDVDLSHLNAYVSYNDNTYTYDMTETDGLWQVEIDKLPDLTEVEIYIVAYDELGNSSKSRIYTLKTINTYGENMLMQIKDIADKGITISTYNSNEAFDGKLIVAGYSEDGACQQVRYVDYTVNNGYSETGIDIDTTSAYYKAFCWDGFSLTKPLMNSDMKSR